MQHSPQSSRTLPKRLPLARLHPLATGEDAFQQWVVRAAAYYGWHGFHVRNSEGNVQGVDKWDAVGWPDWVFWRTDPPGFMLRELKGESGTVGVYQRQRLAQLRAAGIDADVWYPKDAERVRHEFDTSG